MSKKKSKEKAKVEYTKKDLIKYLERWFRDDPEDTIYNISGRTQLLISIKEPDMTKSQFEQIMKKFDGVDTRLEGLENKIDDVKSELKEDIQAVDAKVDAVDAKLDKHIIEGH